MEEQENTTKRKFVVINDQIENGKFCTWVGDDVYGAIGRIMDSIWDFSDSYKDDGDEFHISEMYEITEGLQIDVTFKASSWENPSNESWYILFYDED